MSADIQNNQDVSFQEIVNEMGVQKDLSQNPIFRVLFQYQSFLRDSDIKNIGSVYRGYKTNTATFDLTLSIDERIDTLCLKYNFSTQVFKKNTIIKFANTYSHLMNQIVNDISAKIGNISLINEKEKKYLLDSFSRSTSSK
jgi:uncharacterized protein VirK/YbjX